MKRILAIALALWLLCAAALAEGAAPFALENGVTWGMSQGDVLAVEGTSDVEFNTAYGLDLLYVDDVAFRGSEADLLYIFREDALVTAVYALDPEDMDLTAVVAALDGAYGEHTEDRGKAYFDAMSALTGVLYTAQPEISGVAANWTLPDGTLAIALTGLEAGEDDITVVFVDAAGLYVSSGPALSEPAPATED